MSIRLSQAYSLGKEKREAKFVQSKDIIETPGPGQYEPSVKQTKGKINPSWSLSKDQRDKLLTSVSPGPGSYVVPSKIQEGPKYILGLKPEINPFKNKTEPGPGLYDPRKSETQFSYSIRKRTETSLSPEKMTPGPGHYLDVRDKYYKSIPGSQIGKDMRRSTFLKTPAHDKPAPGSYKTFSFTDRTAAPKFGFGSSQREKDYLSSTQISTLPPGPGQYEKRSTLGDGTPFATMPGRRPDLRPKTGRDAPGAGQYDPDYKPMRKSSPNFSLGKQVRDGELNIFFNNPGATTYFAKDSLTKTHSATWRIGSETRPKQQQYVPPTPGPGKYNMTSTLSGPKFPISSKLDSNLQMSPGPGHYKIDHNYTTKLQTAPQFSVGSQQRIMLKELNKNPGPVYATTDIKKQFQGPKFGFGSSQRMPVKGGGEPGPGSYKIPTQVGNVPTYSMPNRGANYKFV
eukprot:403375078